MSEPRTWVLPLKTLIINDGKGLSAWLRQDREDEIHVIEHAAYAQVVAENERLKQSPGPNGYVRKEMYEQRTDQLTRERAINAVLSERLKRLCFCADMPELVKCHNCQALAKVEAMRK